MAEQGALLEEMPFKCLPSSSCAFHPWWERSMLRATTAPQDLLQGEKRHFFTCDSLESSDCPLKSRQPSTILKGVAKAACESPQILGCC